MMIIWCQVHTSGFEHLTGPLCSIGESECDDLVEPREFDLIGAQYRQYCLIVMPVSAVAETTLLTLSRMTSGPLTPPTVLYRIRGTME